VDALDDDACVFLEMNFQPQMTRISF